MSRILWFVDRLGITGGNMPIWLGLVTGAGLRTTQIQIVSLHKHIGGQLLTRYATRKAPTWMPEKAEIISAAIHGLIEKHKPTACVLSSPESLAVLNMSPEYATLLKLRGAVYDLHGIPGLVMLPISVWHTQLTQKDIANANFGAESQREFDAFFDAKLVQGGDEDEGDTESDEADDDQTEDDKFFYVPQLVPVGQMFLRFDIAKLARIVKGPGAVGKVFDPYTRKVK